MLNNTESTAFTKVAGQEILACRVGRLRSRSYISIYNSIVSSKWRPSIRRHRRGAEFIRFKLAEADPRWSRIIYEGGRRERLVPVGKHEENFPEVQLLAFYNKGIPDGLGAWRQHFVLLQMGNASQANQIHASGTFDEHKVRWKLGE
jgi:hypothetical protein